MLDEPTSNLDNETQENVLKSFAELAKGRTTFILAHRLRTITHADVIVHICDGKIVEQGTHRSLIDERGEYFKMWNREIREREFLTPSLTGSVGQKPLKRCNSTGNLPSNMMANVL